MAEDLRIWRWPYSEFGVWREKQNDLLDETVTAAGVYTDDVLREIAANGFNAIWVHGLLQNVVPSDVFPEFGRRSAKHLAAMRELIARAGKAGIKVFMFMQPPRAIPVGSPFWKHHPEVGGQEEFLSTDDGGAVCMRSLCTSTPKVRRYLKTSAARLASELPDLGGVIMITASEYPSHCWGRRGRMFGEFGKRSHDLPTCERCLDRKPADIVVEIIRLVRDGIRSRSKSQKIVTWNWSWTSYEPSPAAAIIAGLPKDVILMAGFERGGTKQIMGKRRVMDEYSLSYAGPSAQFRRTLAVAQEHNLSMMAKLQIGTTHELATVPSLPLIGNLYDKARAMRRAGVTNFMGCWNFGNMLSANTAAFTRFFLCDRLPSKERALTGFATDYFPGCDAKAVVDAWHGFAGAMDCYPFSIPFLYASPVNFSLGYPLKPGPLTGRTIGRSWLMDKRGDELSVSLKAYSLAEVIRGLGELARHWKHAAKRLDRGLTACTAAAARQEAANAWVCYHSFRSAWNTYRVYRLRRNWNDGKLPAYQRIARNELDNLQQVLPLVKADVRFGYHAEAHAHMYTAAAIRRKIRALTVSAS